ncbi:MAG TPA: CPBP family intramembrane glutamic endopeptidase [Terracidiphilus sp.]|nr:CPBP family intramembrane glutamic endopeptidase [Terracidiphilus sp.]
MHDANAAVTALDAMRSTPETGILQPEGQPPVATNPLVLIFIGPQGLRAGWSLCIFVSLFFGLASLINWLVRLSHVVPKRAPGSTAAMEPLGSIVTECSGVLMILLASWIMAKIERRRIADYNLAGPGPMARFGNGLVVGFLALSVLVFALNLGGWIHFSGLALSGTQILKYAAAWAVAFLMVGCFEEGLARCYLLYTLARGLNFWWALGLVVVLCGVATLNPKASGLWGAYLIALLGLAPCLLLELKKAPSSGFWCATWVTSVMFGAGHTANPGENWIGIFSAAGIGVVFCASVRLTGSVWWAVGCHAAWDWGQSYFYGTPDSGFLAKGHLLNSTMTGNTLWSGGADGPEGSVLVIPTMLLILLALIVMYGRKRAEAAPVIAAEQAAG